MISFIPRPGMPEKQNLSSEQPPGHRREERGKSYNQQEAKFCRKAKIWTPLAPWGFPCWRFREGWGCFLPHFPGISQIPALGTSEFGKLQQHQSSPEQGNPLHLLWAQEMVEKWNFHWEIFPGNTQQPGSDSVFSEEIFIIQLETARHRNPHVTPDYPHSYAPEWGFQRSREKAWKATARWGNSRIFGAADWGLVWVSLPWSQDTFPAPGAKEKGSFPAPFKPWAGFSWTPLTPALGTFLGLPQSSPSVGVLLTPSCCWSISN